MMKEEQILTLEGKRKYEEELSYLVDVVRPQVTQEIKEAKEVLKEGKFQLVRNMFGILLITAVLDFLANLISGGSELVYLILALLVLSVVRVFNFNISKMDIMKRRGEEFSFGDILKLDDFSRAWSVSFSLIPKYKVAIISLLIYVVAMILGASVSSVFMIVALVAYIVTLAETIDRSFKYR